MTTKNPWRGLASYEEPKGTSDDYLFCGRDEETLDVVRLIDNNLFITLYGCSGIGKTSLLKAGVMPILKRRDYYPLYVRLSQEPSEVSYAEAIVRKLKSSDLKEERSIEMEHADGNDRLYLWNYFATTRFRNADGREVYPVVILDQFEEVFRDADKRKAELLLQQIYLLLNDELEMPDQEGYNADTNYRFVASIREDFLFVLEDSIDEFSFDLYKDNRYRLRPMKPENARQVVLVPGKDCIEESEKETVADRFVALAKRNEQGDIDTLLLSLVCAGTFDKKAGEKISAIDLAVWKNNPMEVYYQDAVKGLSAKQIRYIQKHLIREDGSRKRVDAKEVKAALGESTYNALTRGENRMLVLGEHGQVELLHDQLAMAVYEERKAFEERERKKKLRRRIWLIGSAMFIIIILFLVLFVIIGDQQMDLEKQQGDLEAKQWRMMENQARFTAEKASGLVDKGDSYLAQRLLLEVLPQNLSHSDKPYTAEAEAALREAAELNSAILKGHKKNVDCAIFSLDGETIASASDDGTIRIWKTKTGALLNTINVDHYIYSMAYSPDGSLIASGGYEAIKLWNVASGLFVQDLENSDRVNSITFSPDGKYIMSTPDFSRDEIKVWDVASGKLIPEFSHNYDYMVYSTAISPNGKQVVTINPAHKEQARISTDDSDKVMIIWDVTSGEILTKLQGRDNYLSTAFSPDGKQIVSTSRSGEVCIWDAISGQPIKTMKRVDVEPVSDATFSSDGKYVVARSGGFDVVIWDVESCQPIKSFYFNNIITSVALSPDGSAILLTFYDDDRIRIQDSGLKRLYGPFGSIKAYSPERRLIASQSDSTQIWDAETGVKIQTLKGDFWEEGDWGSTSFNPNGELIVTVRHDELLSAKYLYAKRQGITSDPNFENVKIWETKTGHHIYSLKGYSDYATSAVFSPDGNQIVSISQGHTVRFWDTKSGQEIRSLENIDGSSILFNPNGNQFITTSDNIVNIYDASSGQLIHVLDDHTYEVLHVAFSHDGEKIATASKDHTIKIWNSTSGQLIQTLKGHTDNVNYVSFSPNGKYIVSASNDRTIKVWDLGSGLTVETIDYRYSVEFADFSSDGRHIITSDFHGIIRILDFPPLQELIDQTQERFKDYPLTPEERKKYYLE